MYPPSSVSGHYFNHPDSKYFAVGKLGNDQVEDYSLRKDQRVEVSERWLAPYLDYEPAPYDRPMKSFLNRYMAANRALAKHSETVIRPLFSDTVAAIRMGIGNNAFRPFGVSINAAVLESVM